MALYIVWRTVDGLVEYLDMFDKAWTIDLLSCVSPFILQKHIADQMARLNNANYMVWGKVVK